jgi:acetyl esterase
VIGSIDSHDGYCRSLANAANCVVVSVEYRLAPEHKYPAATNDAYAAVEWISQNAETIGGRAGPIGIAGDSAGGNLAAVVALMSRDRGGPAIGCQVLIYPITDCHLETPYYLQFAEDYFLTRRAMIWFWDQYCPNPSERNQPYASPLRAETLNNLPPALILTAQYDPLRDEGEAYAASLREASVPCRLIRYDGMIHGFTRRFQLLDAARQGGSRSRRMICVRPARKSRFDSSADTWCAYLTRHRNHTNAPSRQTNDPCDCRARLPDHCCSGPHGPRARPARHVRRNTRG